MSAFSCGGDWLSGVDCGGRAVYLIYYPWSVDTYIGSRLACDKLAG
jgi:hypothetical protein